MSRIRCSGGVTRPLCTGRISLNWSIPIFRCIRLSFPGMTPPSSLPTKRRATITAAGTGSSPPSTISSCAVRRTDLCAGSNGFHRSIICPCPITRRYSLMWNYKSDKNQTERMFSAYALFLLDST